jgi:hypothetical protein
MFDVGKEHWEMLDRNKSTRSDFFAMTDEIRYYNKIECDLLAEMMTVLRENCHAANIIPRTWSGAGKLAEALHHREHTISRDDIAAFIPGEVLTFVLRIQPQWWDCLVCSTVNGKPLEAATIGTPQLVGMTYSSHPVLLDTPEKPVQER